MGECLIIRGGGGTDTSDGTAGASQILSGYTAYVNDTKLTGSMTNRGAVTSTLAPGGSYTIPEGYHSGSGVISTSTLAANTSATTAAAQMLSGYTGWVNGSKITGTMTNQGTKTYAIGVNGSQTIPAGWHSGSGWVAQSGVGTNGGGGWTPNTATTVLCWSGWYTTGAWTVYGNGNLAASNIKKGVAIFGVTGTFSGYVSGSRIYIVQNGSITGNLNSSVYTLNNGAAWTSGGYLICDAGYIKKSNVLYAGVQFQWGTTIPYSSNVFKLYVQYKLNSCTTVGSSNITWHCLVATGWTYDSSSTYKSIERYRVLCEWENTCGDTSVSTTVSSGFTTSGEGFGSIISSTSIGKCYVWACTIPDWTTQTYNCQFAISNLWVVPV